MLRRIYIDVSTKIDAQSVTRCLFQCNALTLKEVHSIQSRRSEPVKAAERLLNIVIKQSSNVYGLFMNALITTGQKQVYEMIVNSGCKGESLYLVISNDDYYSY